ncbi:MAG: hypothetical protein ACYTFA_09420 [Planctomycetota bacterium]|jgi:phage FluMu protein Com
MSIEIHCTKCGKLIRAPDEAGGRRGKCPYCQESVYVPMPHDDGEEIRVAPIDEDEAKRERELRQESADYIASVGHETGAPGRGGAAEPDEAAGGALFPGEVIDVSAEVGAFITAMRDSKLDEAEQTVARLKSTGTRARDHVQGLINDEMPPQVEGVPPPLVQGFLKKLLDSLG